MVAARAAAVKVAGWAEEATAVVRTVEEKAAAAMEAAVKVAAGWAADWVAVGWAATGWAAAGWAAAAMGAEEKAAVERVEETAAVEMAEAATVVAARAEAARVVVVGCERAAAAPGKSELLWALRPFHFLSRTATTNACIWAGPRNRSRSLYSLERSFVPPRSPPSLREAGTRGGDKDGF